MLLGIIEREGGFRDPVVERVAEMETEPENPLMLVMLIGSDQEGPLWKTLGSVN